MCCPELFWPHYTYNGEYIVPRSLKALVCLKISTNLFLSFLSKMKFEHSPSDVSYKNPCVFDTENGSGSECQQGEVALRKVFSKDRSFGYPSSLYRLTYIKLYTCATWITYCCRYLLCILRYLVIGMASQSNLDNNGK